MTAYCTPCQRLFKGQADLDQHIRKSSAHKKSTQKPTRIQNVPQVKLPPIVLKQQEQGTTSRVKPAKPQQALNTDYSLHTTAEGKHGQPSNAIASSSSAPQISKPAAKIVPEGAQSRWSVIPESEYMGVVKTLSAHCHSSRELEENGFILHPYLPLDSVSSRKCKRCNRQEKNTYIQECTFHPSKRNKWNPKRPYKCCSAEGKGCMTLPTHDFQLPLRAVKLKDFQQTPAASAEPKFRAVSLDCEMAGVVGGASEAIMLCVTDFVTGSVLLNQLINPREKITQMRSSIHGVSKSTLDSAISQGQALSGWEGARSELWRYIDDNTIIVGHALENDLDALRVIHPRVVDSGILARNAVGIRRIRWGLQTLCSELLSVEIRKNKGSIHDCLEDVLATREVVLFCTQSKEAFQSWAKAKQKEEIRLQKERERARQEKKDEQARKDLAKARGGSMNHIYFDSDDEDEVLHWSDIAEDMGWPHPDTGYDPWSD